ncbi:sensor histidine kinase [Pedobacter petrophilus]|uniref:Sensor histidine kinase n=1 Tax=Pedobacter petrophilus TaxID=1908241 RepID=A0A7K0FV20_9SPHI|nr:histidine kinase [Pedobacter petrophilus]MRX75375.1 sensor histidine kinase [Pedobacter petrophilus]
MKKIIFILLNLIIAFSNVKAQNGINFNKMYSAGGKLLMAVDSSAKNVYYSNVFPNQPNTSFSYLPKVKNISFQINFRKNINIEHYRYTILVDDKPIAVNKSINKAQLIDTHAGGDEEVFSSTTLGTFAIKGKVITILGYSIETPLVIDKAVFYGKSLPSAKIKAFAKRFKTDKGVDYSHIIDPKEATKLTFTEKDDELTIVKDRTDIDYIYYTSIKDKQTNKIIFESTSWQYGGIVDETNQLSPYLKFDKNIFKKSGDYEIIIQPMIKWTNCRNCDISPNEIEKYTARYTLAITLDEPRMFSGRTMLIFGIITPLLLAVIFVATLIYIKRKDAKKLAKQYKEKEVAQLQLNSVRSQLNPHFLFNALAGIQNLMNKNEIDNANRYLNKFARLTRNVLDNKELISLTEEKILLDDYLQMEQLRFGLQYKINSTIDLDVQNIEIPTMLLQPFVENAVKHGIAEKGNSGNIEINFNKRSTSLILEIKDNGQGFDADQTYNGLGLTLSKNRISLLNTIYKETPFVLDIQSDLNGTVVTITLKQWL